MAPYLPVELRIYRHYPLKSHDINVHKQQQYRYPKKAYLLCLTSMFYVAAAFATDAVKKKREGAYSDKARELSSSSARMTSVSIHNEIRLFRMCSYSYHIKVLLE